MDKLNNKTRTEVTQALLSKDLAKITRLLNDGVPVSEFKVKNKTDILLETIINRKIIIFNNILDRGFNIKDGEFLYLQHTVRTQELRYVKEIIKKSGKDINYLNKQEPSTGDTALHTATEIVVNNSIIMALSRAGVSWNIQNKNGQTPLHFLLRHHLLIEEKLVDEMFDKKADFTIEDKMGICPLDIIKSFILNEDWKKNTNTQYLLNKLNINK